jgi:hypothetical protein
MTGGKEKLNSGRSYKLTLIFHLKKLPWEICGKMGGNSNNFKKSNTDTFNTLQNCYHG